MSSNESNVLRAFAYSKEFLVGGSATTTACLFTNPLDVVKTRFQLQGELQARNSYQVKYRNVFDAFLKIARHEGIKGLQKGLTSGLAYQIVMNSTRLGLYQTILNSGTTVDSNGKQVFWRLLIAGAVSGSCGALLGNPFYLVKVQMQSAAAKDIAVGYQHSHANLIHGLRNAYRSPGGLFQGLTSALCRVSVGSATQLATFTRIKDSVQRSGLFEGNLSVVVVSSLVSSVAVTMAMTPFDVIATRMFNQKHGALYTGWIDCVQKMYKIEGARGFYKGTIAHYFRIGPHTILTLIIWDRYRKWFL
eukprot:sb/3467261/